MSNITDFTGIALNQPPADLKFRTNTATCIGLSQQSRLLIFVNVPRSPSVKARFLPRQRDNRYG